jgi:hypothetical protein
VIRSLFDGVRRTGLRVSAVCLCLLLLGLVCPATSVGWVLKPTGGWLAQPQPSLFRGCLTGAVCGVGSVDEALATVEWERECVRAEREAFEAFARTVGALSVQSRQSAGMPPGLSASAGRGDRLRTVRDGYRETVMAVPGYEEEYGESLRENMTAEFGEEVAVAVTEGSQFTPQLRQLLVSGAQAAARQRERLGETLDAEHESVSHARAQLREIDASLQQMTATDPPERSFSGLVDEAGDLQQGERRCEQLLETRQREIHRETRQFRRSEGIFLQEYLNTDLDVTFPVLDAALERLGWLRERQRVVVQSVVCRS